MEYVLTFRQYSNALKENRLLGLECQRCSTMTCPPKMTCHGCGGWDLKVVELKGVGTIRTFTANYVAPLGREHEAPYIIVMVELQEGPWIAGNLSGIDPDGAGMGLINREVIMGHQVFPGDQFSDGEAVRPLFSLVEQ